MQWDLDEIKGTWLLTSSVFSGFGVFTLFIVLRCCDGNYLFHSFLFGAINFCFCQIPTHFTIFKTIQSTAYKRVRLFMSTGAILSIVGIILTIIDRSDCNADHDVSQDTCSLSEGLGIILMIATLAVWIPILLWDRSCCCTGPCKNTQLNTREDASCIINCCCGDITLPRCGTCIQCGCRPFHCMCNCVRDNVRVNQAPTVYQVNTGQNRNNIVNRNNNANRNNIANRPQQVVSQPSSSADTLRQQIRKDLKHGKVQTKHRLIGEDGTIETVYGTCSICRELIAVNDDITIISNCNHNFHQACLLPWFELSANNQLKCPNCRLQLTSVASGTKAPS
ncbi:MAG: hypothetical protein EZS28_003724 [Streblomastix strix]|uniref:RING-type domain-containing protein n=1 Tax=Streblomastix strix TaxID=222440 RepID=A0A5J4X2S0_9EUKA|nr:MAG: hypothetical protein EZS28_003724 [Streblomastix strix]